jgi:hypothetical protein
MKKIYLYKTYFSILFLTFVLSVKSQTFTDSNLPIVVITTDLGSNGSPIAIPDEPKVLGQMKIIKRPDGSRNFLTDVNNANFLNYNGRIGIEKRGSTSQSLPKKPYSMTTLIAGSTSVTATANVSLLGMPSENDWILNALAFDPSLIRDNLSYYLARQMGGYSVKTNYCEVVINGQYEGLYMLTEKIKADSNRVNILKILPTENTLPNLSGGYITKADKTTGGDPIAWSNQNYSGSTVNYVHDFPKPTAITVQQNAYIQNEFNNLAIAANANNTSLLTGYPATIDVPTFVDFMILNEFAANVDGYQFSTYFHKDRNGKLRAGPVWDFNLTYGNDLFLWGYDRSKTNTWQFSNGDNEGSKFWTDLFNNPEFKCYFSKRWNQLTQPGQLLHQTQVNNYIDSTVTLLSEAMVREHAKWNTIPNNTVEISTLKNWIANRITWINSNIGGFSTCNNVATPPLVISKINYNPLAITNPTPISSNDQEFIQITNTGSSTINLSGIYFSQLGLTFQFPHNSTIVGNSSIFLASNAVVFQSKNGFAPFGQFTRNLSNKSQNIVLSDAFGNEIDKVEFFDTAPWPIEADGLGSYLQLINNSLDNNLATSWTASSSPLSTDNFGVENIKISIYPNPSNNTLFISSSITFHKIEIVDVFGKLITSEIITANSISTNISGLANGIYLLKVHTDFGLKTEKIIKN